MTQERHLAYHNNRTMAPVVKDTKTADLTHDDVDLDALVEGMNSFPSCCNMTKPLLETSNDSLASSKASGGTDNRMLESSSSSLDEPSSTSSGSPPPNSRCIPHPHHERQRRSKSLHGEPRFRALNGLSSSAPEDRRSKSIDTEESEEDEDHRVPDPFPDIGGGGSPKWKFGLGTAVEELFSKHRLKDKFQGSLDAGVNLECASQVSARVWQFEGSWRPVTVECSHSVEDLITELITTNHSIEDKSWSIVEHLPELDLERTLEDHENLFKVCKKWKHHQNYNRLHFRKDFRKYEVFENPEQFFPLNMVSSSVDRLDSFFETPKRPRQPLSNLLNPLESMPEIQGYLYTREGHKRSWKKVFCVLRQSGLYFSSKGNSKDPKHLHLHVQLNDVDIYHLLNARKKHHAPTDFAFCAKPSSPKHSAKEVKLFCAEDENTRRCWLAAFRLLKYGKTLLGNYQKALDRTIRNKNHCPQRHTESNKNDDGRVMMDFSGKQGRVISNPTEAIAIAKEEEYNWRRRGVRSPDHCSSSSSSAHRHTTKSSHTASPAPSNGFHRGSGSPRRSGSHSPRGSPCNSHSPPFARRCCFESGIHITQPWFHSGLSREETQEMFVHQGMVDGLFLIRESQRIPGSYVLSFSHNQKVKHYQITVTSDQGQRRYSLDEGNTRFTDLVQLVEFYRVNAGGLPTRLLHTCTNM